MTFSSIRRRFSYAAGPLLLLAATDTAAAQVHTPPHTRLDYSFDSGAVENRSPRERVVISFQVHAASADWLRLYFEEVSLAGDVLAGTGATLRLTSYLDGAVQEMNQIHLRQWQNSSAYFNGDSVQVEVVAPANSSASRVRMRAVDAGFGIVDDPTICGPNDDRILSSDDRAGRLLPIGCTSWMIDDCASCFLTAGHCTGNISVVEFNVPLSDANGSINHPPIEDQYAVDASSLQTNGGQGVGDDWGYFGCFPNTNTGLTAFQAQGAAFTLVLPPSVAGNDIRITGYGTDSSPSTRNQVQQTNVGPMVVSTPTAEVGYVTDTTGGNSGSPVIWEQQNVAVGIHTHGGCSDTGGNNWGTSSGHPGLQDALANPKGICAAAISHAPGLPSVLSPGVPTPVEIAAFGTPVPGSVLLHFRYDGGNFQSVQMSPLGGVLWGADLPPAACGDTPEYYFSLDDQACGIVTSPIGAPNDTFSALVGDLTTIFGDDFETNTGWTTQVVGATSGQWQRGVPVNDPNWAYDPVSDSDGSGSCYLTQNEFGNTDVDGGSVRLVSPVFDFSSGGLISYDYYLKLTDADSTDRLLVQANDNGGAGAWTEVARHDTDGGLDWRSHTIASDELVSAGLLLGANMVLRFTANDSDPQSIVEAGVDAFEVSLIECDAGDIGTIYCSPAVPNSSGQPATIRADGSVQVAQNDLTLTAESMPVNQFGYFLASMTQGLSQPPGSMGNLCLGGTIGRFTNQIENSGAGGTFFIAVDLSSIPVSPPQAVLPGDTWNFQGWFRDGATSNFTDGISITFE